MADGKHCPVCQRDIGIWPVFSAGLPNRIYCPHCSSRLSYSGIGGAVVVLVFAMVGAAAVGWHAAAFILDLQPDRQAFVAVGIMFGLWGLIELAAVRFLRNKRVLVQSGTKVQPPEDPW